MSSLCVVCKKNSKHKRPKLPIEDMERFEARLQRRDCEYMPHCGPASSISAAPKRHPHSITTVGELQRRIFMPIDPTAPVAQKEWLERIQKEISLAPVGQEGRLATHIQVVEEEERRVKSRELGVQIEKLRVQVEELRVQIDELRVQSEELRVNEELRDKSEELRVQSEELRVQSEELRD